MTSSSQPNRCHRAILAPFVLGGVALIASCRPSGEQRLQGYLEAELVYVGAPLAGKLEALAVRKGDNVEAGARWVTLEREAVVAARQQAANQLAASEARLSDLKKGSRPSEVAALEARLQQARATAELSEVGLARTTGLVKSQVATPSDYDQARFTAERNRAAVADLQAQVETARLGARSDQIAAAEADVQAAAASLERADWSVSQKAQRAIRGGFIFDTVYREGEFVAAGQPVVALLPPENLKVRFFAPEADVANLRIGQAVRVSISGRAQPLTAKVIYLSPQPEYTPPVLYNRESRAKLVFMVEASVSADVARELHPGQPVDVSLQP